MPVDCGHGYWTSGNVLRAFPGARTRSADYRGWPAPALRLIRDHREWENVGEAVSTSRVIPPFLTAMATALDGCDQAAEAVISPTREHPSVPSLHGSHRLGMRRLSDRSFGLQGSPFGLCHGLLAPGHYLAPPSMSSSSGGAAVCASCRATPVRCVPTRGFMNHRTSRPSRCRMTAPMPCSSARA